MLSTGRNNRVSAHAHVMVTVRYATGKMQLCSGINFGLHDHSTVSRIIQRVRNTVPHCKTIHLISDTSKYHPEVPS